MTSFILNELLIFVSDINKQLFFNPKSSDESDNNSESMFSNLSMQNVPVPLGKLFFKYINNILYKLLYLFIYRCI